MDVAAPEWMSPCDTAILDFFAEHPIRISASILAANIDYTRQYVSGHCQTLKDAGLLFRDGDNLYARTHRCEAYLAGTIDPADIDPDPPTTYTGTRRPDDTYTVLADDVPLHTRITYASTDIDSYAWGYSGTGARDLALALLGDVADGRTALEQANAFRDDVIADLPTDTWKLTAADIQQFLDDATDA